MRTISLRQTLLAIAALGVLLAPATWLLKAVDGARNAARAAQCTSHFFQIALAVANYEAQWGSLPPAYTVDANGKPLLSWRVLILPQMQQQALYARFNPNEPWDGPNNIRLLPEMPSYYACPNRRPDPRDPAYAKQPFTSIVAVSGPQTAFPGAAPRKLSEIKDQREQTLIAVEIANADIPWTAPVDLDVNADVLSMSTSVRPSPSSPDRSGPRAIFADFHPSYALPRDLTAKDLRALSTIDGGEQVDWPPQPR